MKILFALSLSCMGLLVLAAPVATAAPLTAAEAQESWARANHVIGMSADDAGQVTAAVSRDAALPANAPFAVRRSSQTAADLDATQTNLIAFHGKHSQYGMAFYYDAAKDATVVTGNVPDSLAGELRATGEVELATALDDKVTEDIGHGKPAGIAACSRANDCGPNHFGGANINNRYGTCTAGFSMRDTDGGTYSVTAGHCGEINTHWISGQHEYGTTTARPPYPRFDMAKIRCDCGGYAGQIWTGANTTRYVSVAWNPGTGFIHTSGLCVAGGVTVNEICFATISSTSAVFCANFDPDLPPAAQCTTNLIQYARTDGAQMTQGGDSGSAIYDLDPYGHGTAEIVGMHIGRSQHTRNGHLFHTGYAEKYSGIQGQFRGGINNTP
jgi:hypothetical protein